MFVFLLQMCHVKVSLDYSAYGIPISAVSKLKWVK